MNNDRYDLEERLLEYAARIIRLTEHITRSPAGLHVAQQVLRSGTQHCPITVKLRQQNRIEISFIS